MCQRHDHTRFCKKLQLTMDDLINAKHNKATGIANIVVKNLEPLAITDRPVHSINKDEWFVNDEKEGWEGNKPDKVIAETRHGIRTKWPDVFEEQHLNGLIMKNCKILMLKSRE